MMTKNKIIKISFIWKLVVLALLASCSIGEAYAEKLPNCPTNQLLGAKCRCGGKKADKYICNVGQYCQTSHLSSSGNVGPYSSSSYSCVDELSSTTTTGANIISVTGGGSGYNPCKTSCAPKCYYTELTECTFCPLFTAFYNAASVAAKKSINSLSKPIQQLIVMMFALWIAFQVLAFVSSPEVKDLKDLISSLITQSFIVLLIFNILNRGAMDFFNFALEPIYTTGQKLAQTIISPEKVATSASKKESGKMDDALLTKVNAPCSGSSEIIDPAKEGANGVLPKSMGDSILCTMTLIQNRVAQIKALGSASMCYSYKRNIRFGPIPHLNYFFVGFGLWLAAGIMLLAVPFMMIDSVFQMAIASALLPFGIGAYAFKITRGYTKTIWETFLNSMFVFIFISLISLMLVTAYQAIITNATGDLSSMFTEGATEVALSNLLVKLPWFSTTFLQLVFVGLLTWSVLGTAKDFAGEFAGSISNTSIGNDIGTMGASATKSLLKKPLEKTAEAAIDGGTELVKGTHRMVWGGARKGQTAFRGWQTKRFGTQTADNQWTRTNMWGTKFVASQRADGSFDVKKTKKKLFGGGEKETLRGQQFIIRNSSYINSNGETITRQSVTSNNTLTQNMFERNGSAATYGSKTKYQEGIERILNSGSENTQAELAVFAKQTASQLMKNTSFELVNTEFKSQDVKYDPNGDKILVTEIGKNNEITTIEITKDSNGKMVITTSHIDKNGKGVLLKSNGTIHSKTEFKTEDGRPDGRYNIDKTKTKYAINVELENERRYGNATKVNRIMSENAHGFEEELNDINEKGLSSGIREFGRL